MGNGVLNSADFKTSKKMEELINNGETDEEEEKKRGRSADCPRQSFIL
jgi:hypothetical protein